MGFCLLSNIAIAARFAHEQLGVNRTLIVDYDVHHGNGTEAVFYDDPCVLFISTHQYPIYPGTGAFEDIGKGDGRGYTINIPLPAGHGDASYAAIFEQIIWKAAQRFEPNLILVSAGFDAHWADPLAGMRLTLDGFAHISRELVKMADQLCSGKIVFVMEGGYNLEVMASGWANIARILLGNQDIIDPLGAPDLVRPEPSAQSIIERVKQIHHL
jgi:acetoin utilization deacetylase AcuC-like enzyme